MAQISHLGEIVEFEGDKAVVKIKEQTACSECALSSCCAAKNIPMIKVEADTKNFAKGEEVMLLIDDGAEKLGILLAYVLPSMVIFVSLLITKYMQMPDDFCAAAVILCVALYYPFLLLFKKSINRHCRVAIRKR